MSNLFEKLQQLHESEAFFEMANISKKRTKLKTSKTKEVII